MSSRKKFSVGALAVMTAGAMMLSACNGAAAAPEEGTRSLTIGIIPSIAAAPIIVAASEGYFAEEGLDVELVQMAGGARIIEAIVGGSFDAGDSGPAPFIFAGARDVPVAALMTFMQVDRTASPNQVLGSVDSDITALEDIEGRTIGVHAFNSLEDVRLRGSVLPELGLTEDDVEIVEMPWPNMGAALDKGQIDVAIPFEPFSTQLSLQRDKYRSISDLSEFVPDSGLPLDMLMVSSAVQEDRAVSEGLVSAVARGVEFVSAEPDAASSAVAAELGLDEALTSEALKNFTFTSDPEHPIEGLNSFMDMMVRAGALEARVDLDSHLVSPE